LAVPATWPARSVTLALLFCRAAADFERVDFELDAFDRAFGLDRAVDLDRAVGFDRAADFVFAFGAEPLDDRLPDFLPVLLEAGLLFAILIPLLDRGTRLP
jgi:hypothetical protein